jgi:hypothetical protein
MLPEASVEPQQIVVYHIRENVRSRAYARTLCGAQQTEKDVGWRARNYKVTWTSRGGVRHVPCESCFTSRR